MINQTKNGMKKLRKRFKIFLKQKKEKEYRRECRRKGEEMKVIISFEHIYHKIREEWMIIGKREKV